MHRCNPQLKKCERQLCLQPWVSSRNKYRSRVTLSYFCSEVHVSSFKRTHFLLKWWEGGTPISLCCFDLPTTVPYYHHHLIRVGHPLSQTSWMHRCNPQLKKCERQPCLQPWVSSRNKCVIFSDCDDSILIPPNQNLDWRMQMGWERETHFVFELATIKTLLNLKINVLQMHTS